MKTNLKVLVADDDNVSRFILKKILEPFSREVLLAKTGVEAVTACQDNPDIDLILMDALMPYMNGIEAVKKIREFNKNVIIIMQSAIDNLGKDEEIEYNEYIRKPIRRELLFLLMEKYF